MAMDGAVKDMRGIEKQALNFRSGNILHGKVDPCFLSRKRCANLSFEDSSRNHRRSSHILVDGSSARRWGSIGQLSAEMVDLLAWMAVPNCRAVWPVMG